MRTIDKTPKAKKPSEAQLIKAVTITLPPILRQMVDEITEAGGRSFEDFNTEYARMIVRTLLEVAHNPQAVPVEHMFGMDESIDCYQLYLAHLAAVSYQKRLPKPGR